MNDDPRVVVIGGGATGTGIARDLAMRVLDALLVEKGNLATVTTGRMHGLLHSGGRYAIADLDVGFPAISFLGLGQSAILCDVVLAFRDHPQQEFLDHREVRMLMDVQPTPLIHFIKACPR